MIRQIYFHEKCTADAINIIKQFREEKRAKEFINALIEAYQLLYESNISGNALWNKFDFPTSEKRYIPVSRFPYIIIFTKSSNKIIVLGITYCTKAMTHF